eukprot:jgi/Bigna1/87955/estExt_fgenesh1_pg.C_260081
MAFLGSVALFFFMAGERVSTGSVRAHRETGTARCFRGGPSPIFQRIPRLLSCLKASAESQHSDIPGSGQQNFGRILAVDFGRKRTGVALGFAGIAYQTLPILATPGTSPQDFVRLADTILSTAERENVGAVVVGIPVGGTGNVQNWRLDTTQAGLCRELGRTIARLCQHRGCDIAVLAVDEAGSSRSAREELGLASDKRLHKGEVDSMAAQFIAKRSGQLSMNRSNKSSGYKKKWTETSKAETSTSASTSSTPSSPQSEYFPKAKKGLSPLRTRFMKKNDTYTDAAGDN